MKDVRLVINKCTSKDVFPDERYMPGNICREYTIVQIPSKDVFFLIKRCMHGDICPKDVFFLMKKCMYGDICPKDVFS